MHLFLNLINQKENPIFLRNIDFLKLRTKRSQLVVYTFEGVETAGDLVINFSADHDDLGTVDYLELLVEPK